MKKREVAPVAAVVLFVAATAAVLGSGAAPGSATDRPNVVMISLDTTRLDHIPCYGYHRNTAPNLCELANESIVFDNAVAQMPWSAPSYGSLFTGMYAPVHGFPYPNSPPEDINNRIPLPSRYHTIAETLGDAGYETAAFVAGNGPGPFEPERGLDQGFDTYDWRHVRFNETIPRGIEWLDRDGEEPFFMFFQGYDVHDPYRAPEPYRDMYMPNYTGVLENGSYTVGIGLDSPDWILDDIIRTDDGWAINRTGTDIPLTEEDMRYIRARYDGEIRFTDHYIGKLIDALKDRGVYDNTIIVVFGDHGENLGEYLTASPAGFSHWFLHANLHDGNIQVPLLIRAPDTAPRRVETQVELIDLYPTLMDLVRIDANTSVTAQFQGDPLRQTWTGTAPDGFNRYVYAGIHEHAMVRTTEWKLIVDDRPFGSDDALYHLTTDPDESTNLLTERPDVASRLYDKYEEWRERNLLRRAQRGAEG